MSKTNSTIKTLDDALKHYFSSRNGQVTIATFINEDGDYVWGAEIVIESDRYHDDNTFYLRDFKTFADLESRIVNVACAAMEMVDNDTKS